MVPTMIVDTERLLTYSPVTGEIHEVDWLVLHRMFDVGGAVVTRMVDVVSKAGVAAMIERYRAAGACLRATLDRHFESLEEIGKQQQQWWCSTGKDLRTATVKL